MGAGKEAPPTAGDGAAAAAAPEPVVLRMVLHCDGCAKKVKKSIHRMPGVVSVAADAAANTVVVAGTADAAALKARIEARTKKPVEIVSAPPSKPPPAADPKKSPGKDGGEQQQKSPDKGDKAGPSSSSSSQPPQPKAEEDDKGKKQPPDEKKPAQETPAATTALLRIRLHCDGCADRIRRRIYKIKGVKDVVLEGNAKDEVQVVGTMDVPAMVAYLNGKLNRTVELAAPAKKDDKKDKGGDGDGHVKQKDKAPGEGAHTDKGKGVEVAGPSMASAAASMAPAPVQASTHHVSPYGNVAYPQPQGPPPGYYGGGNAGGAGYAIPYYQQPRYDAGGYYQQPPSADAGGGYYQHQPRGDAGSYYQHQPSADGNYYHPGGYGQDQHPDPRPYPPPYGFDMSPAPQMFSDENPNGCSVM